MWYVWVFFFDFVDENDFVNVDVVKVVFVVLRENMFIKIMVMNVWKCEVECFGWYYVYIWCYIKYVVKIFVVLNDRINFEVVF